jgi:type IV pilus assembly protein PilF
MRHWQGFGLLSACLALLACSGDPAKEPNERSPSDVYVLKGVQYLENGRLDVALEDLKHAVELDEGNAEAHNALGVVYERLNQAEEAERQYQRALALDENHFAAANNYGRLLCAERKYDQAMKRFQTVIDAKSYPTPWLAQTNAGLCAKAQGLGADAENFLRKALESNPNFAPALLEMAKLSLDKRNYLSARAFLQRFESVVGPTPEALFLGLQTEQALGNRKDAEAYRKRLQQQFPDSKEALRSLKSHAIQ